MAVVVKQPRVRQPGRKAPKNVYGLRIRIRIRLYTCNMGRGPTDKWHVAATAKATKVSSQIARLQHVSQQLQLIFPGNRYRMWATFQTF